MPDNIDTRQYPWGEETPTCNFTNFYPLTGDYCVGDTTKIPLDQPVEVFECYEAVYGTNIGLD